VTFDAFAKFHETVMSLEPGHATDVGTFSDTSVGLVFTVVVVEDDVVVDFAVVVVVDDEVVVLEEDVVDDDVVDDDFESPPLSAITSTTINKIAARTPTATSAMMRLRFEPSPSLPEPPVPGGPDGGGVGGTEGCTVVGS